MPKDKRINAVGIPSQVVSTLTQKEFRELCHAAPNEARYPVYLDFSGQKWQLTSLSHLYALKRESLKELDVSFNKLTSLEELTDFPVLKRLRATHNLLYSVWLVHHRLVFLDLSHNNLTSIPDLAECTNLRLIDLSNNQVSGRFQQLIVATKLNYVDLSYNQIDWESESDFLEDVEHLRSLPKLTQLYMSNNPFMVKILTFRAVVLAHAPSIQDVNGEAVTWEEKGRPPGGLRGFFSRKTSRPPDFPTIPITGSGFTPRETPRTQYRRRTSLGRDGESSDSDVDVGEWLGANVADDPTSMSFFKRANGPRAQELCSLRLRLLESRRHQDDVVAMAQEENRSLYERVKKLLLRQEEGRVSRTEDSRAATSSPTDCTIARNLHVRMTRTSFEGRLDFPLSADDLYAIGASRTHLDERDSTIRLLEQSDVTMDELLASMEDLDKTASPVLHELLLLLVDNAEMHMILNRCIADLVDSGQEDAEQEALWARAQQGTRYPPLGAPTAAAYYQPPVQFHSPSDDAFA